MFQKISIENYKSIKSLPDFELKPVNILIGANNSGKSNFLDVFAFLRDTLLDDVFQNHNGSKEPGWRGALTKRGGGESVCFAGEKHFRITCFGDPLQYSLEISSETGLSNFKVSDEEFLLTQGDNGAIDAFGPLQMLNEDERKRMGLASRDEQTDLHQFIKFHLNDANRKSAHHFRSKLSQIKIYDRLRTEIWSPVRMPQKPKGETILDEDGGNLVGVLHQLAQTVPRFLERLNSLLRALFRDFAQISFPSSARGELVMRWEDKNGRFSNTSQLSDGTLKFLALYAILNHPSPPALIGIDEIDANLHPKMQVILAGMIEEAAPRTQIIATTHNPDFVSMFHPDEILILQQYYGATEVRRFSTKGALDLWLKNFGTRKLWLMGELESRW